jgi:hypothetical protein
LVANKKDNEVEDSSFGKCVVNITDKDMFVSLSYEKQTRSLLCVTITGKAVVWRFYPDEGISTDQEEGFWIDVNVFFFL